MKRLVYLMRSALLAACSSVRPVLRLTRQTRPAVATGVPNRLVKLAGIEVERIVSAIGLDPDADATRQRAAMSAHF